MNIAEIVSAALQQKASDIHISPGLPVLFRINGDIIPQNTPQFSAENLWNWAEILTPERITVLKTEKQVDFSMRMADGTRLRANAFLQHHGPAFVFRILSSQIPSLSTYPFPAKVPEALMNFKTGLVLVVGPTGSGKTTTLAAIVQEKINQSRSHVITIEDPIEYVYRSNQSLVSQREVGQNVPSFRDGLRGALREDPDVLLVGEMRDYQTISAALTMAETGHLVFSTLHTNTGPETITRIIDSFPGDQQNQVKSQLATSLRMIISQRLIKTADGAGRVMAYEVLTNNYAVATKIRDEKIFQIAQVIEMDQSGLMVSFEESLAYLIKTGKITQEAAFAEAQDKNHLKRLLGMPVE